MTRVAAVDIGAGSGRVVLADLSTGVPTLTEVSRFTNGPDFVGGRWTWDVGSLRRATVDGLEQARSLGAESLGIDTWAIDYGVIDEAGGLVGPVIAYRDDRHVLGVDRTRAAGGLASHCSCQTAGRGDKYDRVPAVGLIR